MEAGALRPGDPTRLGSYELVGRLGEGGQGAVFLATDEEGRQVAVKLLHADLTADEKARARFVREVEVAKAVAGFCTAQVLDVDSDGDRPYIVSEYVSGPSLYSLVQDEGPLAESSLERLAVGTATALVAIHQADIAHRDFKPHNVLIGPDGPRVIDFGISRALSGSTTLTSRVVGTPAYMAPEQLEGAAAGKPADVFCWAATMVFAATGNPPFGQDTIPAVINRILHKEPELGELSGPLRDVLAACLAKDPVRRPPARDVLMRLLGHEDPGGALPEAADEAADEDAGEAGGETDGETALLVQGSVSAADLGGPDGAVPPEPPEPSEPPVGVSTGESETGRLPAVSAGWALHDTVGRLDDTGPAGRFEGTFEGASAPGGRALKAAAARRPAAVAGVGAVVLAVMAAGLTFAVNSRDGDGGHPDVPDVTTELTVSSTPVPAGDEPTGPTRPPVRSRTPEPSASVEEPVVEPSSDPSAEPSTDPSAEPSGPPVDPGPDDPSEPPADPGTDPGTGPGTGTGGGSTAGGPVAGGPGGPGARGSGDRAPSAARPDPRAGRLDVRLPGGVTVHGAHSAKVL